MFSRNIGLITEEDQLKLKNASILIAGVGGMGGVCAEMLVRMGVQSIKICDHDHYEEANFNRQIHANKESIGIKKVEVLKKEFLLINENLNIEVFDEGVTLENVDSLLEGVDVVVNGMDQMYFSLILERRARAKEITIVDAWLTPYASVFVMTPDSPHWEEFLDLPTQGVAIEDLTPELCNEATAKEVEYTFSHFRPYDIISKDFVLDVVHKKKDRPSFAPVVWMSGALMANEVFKYLTGQQYTDYRGVFFNQYDLEIQKGAIGHIQKEEDKVAA